jgi:hypothetical protein
MGLSFDSVDGDRPGHGPDLPASNWYHQSQQSHHKRQQVLGYTPFFVMDVRVLWIIYAEARKRTYLVIGS